MNIIGDIDGKDVILVDDIIDTAGTITSAAAQHLKQQGAKKGLWLCNPWCTFWSCYR